jgi:L-alanine-DL-glutamate epimerase-like enolase superfamily enzyme
LVTLDFEEEPEGFEDVTLIVCDEDAVGHVGWAETKPFGRELTRCESVRAGNGRM